MTISLTKKKRKLEARTIVSSDNDDANKILKTLWSLPESLDITVKDWGKDITKSKGRLKDLKSFIDIMIKQKSAADETRDKISSLEGIIEDVGFELQERDERLSRLTEKTGNLLNQAALFEKNGEKFTERYRSSEY